jgi:DivIVA domain-containing protein
MESDTPTPPSGSERISSEDVRRATFPQALRGYDREAVHDLLDRVADWMEGKSQAVSAAAPGVREELAKVGERTAGILTAAEEAGQKILAEATEYAERLRADADSEARAARLNASQRMDEMIAEAEQKAQRIIDDAVSRRRQLNQAISSLLERRDEIADEAARLADELMSAVEALRSPDGASDAAMAEDPLPGAGDDAGSEPGSEEHELGIESVETELHELDPKEFEADELQTGYPATGDAEAAQGLAEEAEFGEPPSEGGDVDNGPPADEATPEELRAEEDETEEEERREPPTLLVDPDADDDFPPRRP